MGQFIVGVKLFSKKGLKEKCQNSKNDETLIKNIKDFGSKDDIANKRRINSSSFLVEDLENNDDGCKRKNRVSFFSPKNDRSDKKIRFF